jgi:hypothetical protein
MKLDPVLSNPYLGYRLDPYEPGLISQAKASESALYVTARERRNLTRLVAQATQEGRTVVWAGISYQPTVAGSYMGVAAGQTTVISIEKPIPANAPVSEELLKGTEKGGISKAVEDQNQAGQNVDSPAPESTASDPQPAQASLAKLAEQEVLLQAKIATLKSEL